MPRCSSIFLKSRKPTIVAKSSTLLFWQIACWRRKPGSNKILERGLRPIGYFGASTGAAAALQAAARQPASIGAVVSRGGRPDLAERYLPLVAAPTLLIVGGEDLPVIQMNKEAFVQLTCPKELIIVPGATHLFEEPGTLEQVADHAQRWFQRSHLELIVD